MKQSKIKRIIPKKLARQLAQADERTRPELARVAELESADAIERMRKRGYELVTRLDTGEGVFVREDRVVGLHIQLPVELYKRLNAECARRETTKRRLVIDALEEFLRTGTRKHPPGEP